MWNHVLSKFSLNADFGKQVCANLGGPYPLIGITLNNYRVLPKDDDYAPFFFSPLYSGSEPTKYTPTVNMAIGLEATMGKNKITNLILNLFYLF